MITILLYFTMAFHRSQANSCSQSRQASNDVRLHGHVIKNISGLSGGHCLDSCKSEDGCRSINYHPETKQCQLNSVTNLTNPENFVPSQGFLYFNVKTGVPKACSDAYCAGKGQCLFNRTLGKPYCLLTCQGNLLFLSL